MSNREAARAGDLAVQSVQSVDRAVRILEILAREGEAGVTEVAGELGVHKSTASRLLAALDRRELVTQDAARGKFRLGVGIVRLAGAASARLDVLQESRAVCRMLAHEVGETVNLAILSGRDALYLDQAAGPADAFPALLAEVRRRGYATAVDELEAGLTAIAAPVRDAAGTVIASISASGPSFRIPAARVEVLAVAVRRAAGDASRRLGWHAR
jgi:DNA-binding IclR family transcriptional regulator